MKRKHHVGARERLFSEAVQLEEWEGLNPRDYSHYNDNCCAGFTANILVDILITVMLYIDVNRVNLSEAKL